MYFLDTNICIHFLNGSSDSIRDNILSLQPRDIKIPVIVSAELLFGARKSARMKENQTKVVRFLKPFEIISFTPQMSQIYAELAIKVKRMVHLLALTTFLLRLL